jgi:hypothetical protein
MDSHSRSARGRWGSGIAIALFAITSLSLTGAGIANASDWGRSAQAPADFVATWGTDQAGTAPAPSSLAGKHVLQVAATSSASYALTDDGRIAAWGDDGTASAAIPSTVAAAHVVSIEASTDGEVFARTMDGALYGWGCPAAHSYPDIGDRLPAQVQPLTSQERAARAPSDPPVPAVKLVTDIASNNGRTVAVTADGGLVEWSCGDPQGNRPYADDLPAALSGSAFTHVAASGAGFTIVADGSDYSAQDNARTASWWNPATPAQPVQSFRIASPKSFGNVFGGARSWLLDSTGTITAWDGTNSASQPAVVPGPVTDVATGFGFSLAISADGTLTEWNDATSALVPLPGDFGDRRFAGVAAAGGHVVAIVSGEPDPTAGGQAVVLPAPVSVQTGAWESDSQLRVFAERVDDVLTSPVTVDGTTIAAGTKVNVYYAQADAVGSLNTLHTFTGTLAFPTPILGIAVLSADLQATTPVLGHPGTSYSTSPDQGAERWYGDSIARTADGKGLSLTFSVYNTSDAVRIITAVP